MTKEEIDALEGLLKAATPGPLKVTAYTGGQYGIGNTGPRGAHLSHVVQPHDCHSEADMAALVGAVNALPALIAEVREAGARELEAVADDMGDDLHASLAECRTVYQEAAVFASYLRSRAASLRKDAR